MVRSRALLLFLLVFTIQLMVAQQMYFPPITGGTWENIDPVQLQWKTQHLDSLYSYLEDNNSKAFMVLHNGRIALEKYFGTFTKDSIWYWASAGKTLTAFGIGLAQQEGKLSIYDTTSKYLGTGWTSLPLEKEKAITIRHQLTMTTGLNDAVPDDNCTTPGCLIYRADAGTRWAYHNAPYTLLDSVIIKATGQNLNQFLYQRLYPKTGIAGLYIRNGYNNVYYSTPRNMARYGLLLLNKGKWDNQVVLQDTVYFRQMTHPSQTLNNSYGYLTWLNGQSSYMIPQTQFVFPGYIAPAAPADMFAAMGKNGQFINVIPSLGMVWIRMGDAPDNSLVPFLMNDKIWERLNPVINRTTGIHDVVSDETSHERAFTIAAHPNPFNPEVTISYQLPKTESVSVVIYNVTGEQCVVLLQGVQEAGKHRITWNGVNAGGRKSTSGVYVCRIVAGSQVQTIKLLLLQ